jgi:hypothetical protein
MHRADAPGRVGVDVKLAQGNGAIEEAAAADFFLAVERADAEGAGIGKPARNLGVEAGHGGAERGADALFDGPEPLLHRLVEHQLLVGDAEPEPVIGRVGELAEHAAGEILERVERRAVKNFVHRRVVRRLALEILVIRAKQLGNLLPEAFLGLAERFQLVVAINQPCAVHAPPPSVRV